jgi:hypothetical protein
VQVAPQLALASMNRKATTWDLNLEGGYGKELADGGRWTGWGRVRAGLLVVREPRFFALGATLDIANRQRLAIGFQGEVIDTEMGLWLQVGPAMDTKGRLGGSIAAGLSLFGVEAQRRHVDGLGDATILLGKLRIPLGVIGFATTR